MWVTDSKYNRLMRNTGKMQFDDIGAASGISPVTGQYVSWGSGIYDFDNDGILDILTFHGGLIHLIPEEHSVFKGVGKGQFVDVSRQAGPVFDVKTVARGACFGDYDNDGKVDAFLVNLGAKGNAVSQHVGEYRALADRQAEGHEEQSRWHWRAAGGNGGGKDADCGARGGVGLSVAGRRPGALRTGQQREGGEVGGEVAERTRAGAGERGRGSHS